MPLHDRQKLGPDYWRDDGLAKNTLPPPKGLLPCNYIADIGAGIRPMQWYEPESHICVEPCQVYADKLKKAGYVVFQESAHEWLSHDWIDVEGVYILDCIEHMEKITGQEVIKLAVQKAKVQVVIYTPDGYMHQDTDVWGLGQHDWQAHRSAWKPHEFGLGWRTEKFGRGFYASYDV